MSRVNHIFPREEKRCFSRQRAVPLFVDDILRRDFGTDRKWQKWRNFTPSNLPVQFDYSRFWGFRGPNDIRTRFDVRPSYG